MTIEKLMSPVIEDYTANMELNDDEIIAIVQKAEIEENDDQENEDKSLKTTATVQTAINSWLILNQSSMIAWQFIVFHINKFHVCMNC
ncbi:hypothetical protein Plhal304r1_c062g0149881 [Plasmopara halstedii]